MGKRTKQSRPSQSDDLLVDGGATWYKDAVIYQLHVRSFFDSNGDGVGDFRGLTQKLDYLQDLGVTALWLLPFYPSPLRDDGYDIADYTSINPAYGNLKDFKTFVAATHERGMRVITELVINHTSDQHPWFQRARRAKPCSPDRDFYVWSDTPEKYEAARIIFKDYESSNWTWDPLARSYYWHRFFSHQPDLNFENPRVQQATLKALDFWCDLGVDGLRLDAIPYLFEREGTNCENLPETHVFLKTMRRHLDEHYPGRMFLAEANQWPEDAIAYFGEGDECHTAFHFPVMPRLYMSLHMEDRFPILDILQQTPPIPENCQWIMFLRNHDELTLEMVTDEERDYMYRAYAHDRQARINLGIRRRLAPLLGNHRARIQLMNGLLLSLPGTPVIYYGDEIGMGDNIYLGDRHGVRTPMQWTPDRNAGFSTGSSQRLFSPVISDGEYSFATVNVELQQKNPHSLLWWTKRMIAARQNYQAFGRGDFLPVSSSNPKVLSFVRRFDGQTILVVANLSRFTQFVELALAPFAPCRPVEVFGQTRLPPATQAPYPLTLGPHVFHWFLLECETEGSRTPSETRRLTVDADALDLLRGRQRSAFESVLVRQLATKNWLGGRSQAVTAVVAEDCVSLGKPSASSLLLVVLRIYYRDGEPEPYLLPLGVAWGEAATQLVSRALESVVVGLRDRQTQQEGVLFHPAAEPALFAELLEVMQRERQVASRTGSLAGVLSAKFDAGASGAAKLLQDASQTTLSSAGLVIFVDRYLLKILSHPGPGEHPLLELQKLLGEQATQSHLPRLIGSLEYRGNEDEPSTVAILEEYDSQSRSACQLSQDWIGRFIEQLLALSDERRQLWATPESRSLWQMAEATPPEFIKELTASFLDHCVLLGQRVAELHASIAARDDARFAPEKFSKLFQRSLYQTSRKLVFQTVETLQVMLDRLPTEAQDVARQLIAKEKELLDRTREILQISIATPRLRCHGNLHLGQVLFTGKDFVISDLDASPNVSYAARRTKQASLCDVASLVYSLRHVAGRAIRHTPQLGVHSPQVAESLQRGLDLWYCWSSSALLKGYQPMATAAGLFPQAPEERDLLLPFYLRERALLELGHTLDEAPDQAENSMRILLELTAT